jgi:transposase
MEQTSEKKTSNPYSPEFRARAVRLAMEHGDEYQSEAAALAFYSMLYRFNAIGSLE